MVDHAKSCRLPAGCRTALFTALQRARWSVGALDVNKCVTLAFPAPHAPSHSGALAKGRLDRLTVLAVALR